MIPKKALEQAAAWFLQVGSFDSSLILENRLASVMSGGARAGGLRGGIEPFLEGLAAPTGTPGGGSAAAAAAAMAAGLATMVASMSRGKKAYLEHARELGEAIARLTELREELTAAIEEDAEAYDGVVKAYREARASTGAEGAVNAALERATRVPWEVAQRALEVAAIAETLGPITNPNMRSDLATAVALAKAGVEGARANVEINLESLKDGTIAAELRQKLAALTR